MKRETICLNGKWDIVFDPANTGKDKHYAANFPQAKAESIDVPNVWERIRPNYDGVAWYRRTIELTAAQLKRRVLLVMGETMYASEVYLNGELVGKQEGGHHCYTLDITSKARAGDNELVVRVISPPMDRKLEGMRAGAPLNQGNLPVGKAAWYFNYGGIWGDCELIITDRVRVDDIYVQPYPSKKQAVLNVTVVNKAKAGTYELTCRISPAKGKAAAATVTKTVRLKKGENAVRVPVSLPNARLWSPDDPYLYDAEATLAGDGMEDVLSVRFGMRECTIKKGKFYLNGEPIILKGFLQQGMYPRTLVCPENEAMARKEFELLKKNGFNFMRVHLKPNGHRYLDLADEYGVMVEAEPCIGWISNSPETEQRCWTQISTLIKEQRNHPSIIFWCLMNEAYHFRGFAMSEIKRMTNRLGRNARKLDSTRLLMDTSGGGGSGTVGGSSIMLPNSEKTAEMIDAHAYCPMPASDASLEDYRTQGAPGVALFISEFGAPDTGYDYDRILKTYTPAERKLGLEDYQLHKDFSDSLQGIFDKAGLKTIFGSMKNYCRKVAAARSDDMRLVTLSQRSNPRLAGTAFCQLADASGELFGATDVWRNPKPTFKALADAVRTPMLAPQILPRVAQAGQPARVRATLINERELGVGYDWTLAICKGKTVVKSLGGKAKAEKPVQVIFNEMIPMDIAAGKYTLVAGLKRGGKALSRETVDFTVLPAASAKTAAVSVCDGDDRLNKALAALGVKAVRHSNNHREKNIPLLIDARKPHPSYSQSGEIFGQAKKMVQTGGAAVVFQPTTMLLYQQLIDDLIQPCSYMRPTGYLFKHPIFKGLPSNGVMDYEFADIMPTQYDNADQVTAAGGEILCGMTSSHMWTRPACYFWGAGLYELSIGRGKVIICHFDLLNNLDKPVARTMLANLIDYAAGQIKPGLEEKLLSRCIDPLSPKDWA